MADKGIEVITPTALEARTRAEIDMQIATAKQYPRDIARSLKNVEALITSNREIAEECHYALPRGGKVIEGPSVRFAEIIAANWQNLRVASEVVEEGERTVTVRAVCHDLETNVAIASEVSRRITGKDGRRYGDDMIAMTMAAAGKIAMRNAVFSVIPKAIWKGTADLAKKTAEASDKVPIRERVKRALAWFEAHGAKRDQVFRKLGVKNSAAIKADHLNTLNGMRVAIVEESSTIEEMFADVRNKIDTPATVIAQHEEQETSRPAAPGKEEKKASTNGPSKKEGEKEEEGGPTSEDIASLFGSGGEE